MVQLKKKWGFKNCNYLNCNCLSFLLHAQRSLVRALRMESANVIGPSRLFTTLAPRVGFPGDSIAHVNVAEGHVGAAEAKINNAATLTGLPGSFFTKSTQLALRSMEVVDEECFLRYRVLHSNPVA